MSTEHKHKSEQDAEAPVTITVAVTEWESAQTKLRECEEKYLLAAADFENMKKRLQKRADESVKYAIEKLVTDVLLVVDDLDRAITSLDQGHDPKDVLKGLHLAQSTFHKILEQNGVEVIACVNKPYDANLHEAVAEVTDPAREDEEVIEEVQKGYTLHGRLVRASKVKISKKA